MIDRYQLLAAAPQLPQRRNQLCRIHFILRRTGERVSHRNETIRPPAADQQSAGFVWIMCGGMLDDAVEQAGCNNQVHRYIMAGKGYRR